MVSQGDTGNNDRLKEWGKEKHLWIMVNEKLKNVNKFTYLGRIALTPRKFNQLLSWTIILPRRGHTWHAIWAWNWWTTHYNATSVALFFMGQKYGH